MSREKIIIFGASNLGKIAYNVLHKIYDIVYFADNDCKKWNSYIEGKKIISPNELVNFKEYKIIISSMYSAIISQQLFQMGLTNVEAFRCFENETNGIIWRKEKVYDKNFFKEVFKIYNKQKNDAINSLCKNNKKKVLIISYVFPPLSGSGVQRTLKYVKYLRSFGWEPIVITVGNTRINIPKDSSLLDEIDDDINVIRIDQRCFNYESASSELIKKIFRIYENLVKNKELLNEYFRTMIYERNLVNLNPDNYIFWTVNVLEYIKECFDIDKVDIIYTTGSPYSTHIIGYMLKSIYDKKWVVDFRDEWTNNHHFRYNKESLNYRVEYEMEKNIVELADKVITVTPISTNNFINRFNLRRNKVVTITNGYDEDDFSLINEHKKNNKFTIVYNGTVHKECEPNNFLQAINELIDEKKIDSSNICIKFVGCSNGEVQNRILNMNKYKIINIYGYVEHNQCIKEIINADLLLLLVGKGDRFKCVYTGKIFEYIRTYNRIVSLAPKSGVVDQLLQQTKNGNNYELDDINGIKKYVFKCYLDWKNDRKLNNVNKYEVNKYERKLLTKKLVEVFNSIIGDEV